jgi:hypothetical protein
MEDHDDIETTLYRSEASILRGPGGGGGGGAAAAAALVQLLTSASPPLSSNQTRHATTAPTTTSALYYRNGQQQQQQQLQQQQPQLYWWRIQVATSLVVFWVGWRLPKAVMDRDESLLSRPPPYQVTAAGDVLLDFTLNQPLVDPPTISCTYPQRVEKMKTFRESADCSLV